MRRRGLAGTLAASPTMVGAVTVMVVFLAVFLAPLLRHRSWTIAILMMPLMVAPSLVGLMYRLVLHEFVGPVPYYFYLLFGWSPSFLSGGTVFWTLVAVEIPEPFGPRNLAQSGSARAPRVAPRRHADRAHARG